MNPVLKVDQLRVVTLDGRVLVRSLSFSLLPGQCLLIQGPNGSGKTSVLRTLLRLQKCESGEIHYGLNFEDLCYLPQIGNVRSFLPLRLKDVIRLEVSEAHSQVSSVEALGLLSAESLEHDWNTASGGERQKVLLTRALLKKPKLMVLDEPLNHLDAPARKKLIDTLRSYLIDQRGALILISHDVALEGLQPDQVINLEELS